MRMRIPGGAAFAGLAAMTLACFAAAGTRAAQAGGAAPATREVTDETGRQVAIPMTIRRIVSLAPNLTETIYALGAQDYLVGDTDYCDYPAEAMQKPHVGGAQNPNLEAVVALKPDLVLATTAINRRVTVDALERLGVAVYATAPRTVEDVLHSMRTLAELLGAGPQGETAVAQLEAKLSALHARLAGQPKTRAIFVVWASPFISIGPRTFLADALRCAGAESVIESRADWPRVSVEEVVRLKPEYLVFAEASEAAGLDDFESLAAHPGWRELEAVKKKRIAIVSDALNRPAPRMIDAIEQLARKLHPAAFAPKQENGKKKAANSVQAAIQPPTFSSFCFQFSQVGAR